MTYYWIDIIDDFLIEKEVNEWLSLSTIKIYNTMFNLLCDNPFVNISDLSTFTEINFKKLLWNSLIKNKWCSHTYNKYRKNYRVFCKYLVTNWFLEFNPLANIKIRKVLKSFPKYLTTKQIIHVQKLININFSDSDFMTLRNKTILFFYMYTWLRLYELINLKMSDIDFIHQTIKITNWKWWKDRLVPMIYQLSDLLIPYLIKLKNSKIKTNIVFPTRFGWLMQHRDVYNILNKIKSQLDFHLTPHMFRHTFATELVRKNINIYNISRILWHSDLKTTQIYLWLDIDSVTVSLNKSHIFNWV